ncbi:aldehyde dehydrogenase family protein [Sporosarcina sp. 179-K 3D1 HS]|uniref:aldehyde dehydrogenase family protein n=1 Tax=Sporosarcina sp. 179-K 3D1 HS TaxID=3232169 RepID=UPI0039A3A6B1
MTIATEIKEYYNLIDGKVIPATTGETVESTNPATGKAWAKIPKSKQEDAEAAIQAARKAFPGWKALPASERADYLRRVGDLIGEHGEELAALETQDNGWVIRETTYGLIPVLQQLWVDAAGATSVASRGETIQVGPTSFGYTLREPLGVVVGIAPWNAPLFTFTIKAAYALAAGNTVVIKPSEQAAVSSLRYAELLNEILPPGVVNVVCGSGRELGDVLVSHQEVNKVSLTGSGGTAQAIAKATSSRPKPLILELGGKSANIVFEDADLDKVIDGITIGSIFTGNAGQICVGGSRILIQRSIFDEVVKRMKERMTDTTLNKLGDTMNLETTMGPIATASQYEQVRSYIEIGVKEGAEIIFGGRHGGDVLIPDQADMAEGYWIEPTLLKVENNTKRVCQEEIFGPVAVVMPFDTEEEAIELANDTAFGLAAGIWTTNLSRAHRMVQAMEAGNVWVNTYARVGADLPFGGVKASGQGTDSALEYTYEKACVIEM